jgi:hypothetical protein
MTREEADACWADLVSCDWMHVGGKGPYRVFCLADVASDSTEEPTVVYQGLDGRTWTRKLSNFHERMRRMEGANRSDSG